MAGYRPMDLAPLGASTIQASRASTYADRRRAAAERLSVAADLKTRLDAAMDLPVEQAQSTSPIDPNGVLRAAIRALLPLAYRTDGFDVTVSLGPDHEWAAQLSRGPQGLVAELVPGPKHPCATDLSRTPRAAGPSGPSTGVSASEAEIAGELADLVWSGEVGVR
ncbi:MAG TPA: hypothetical protein VHN80_19560 [Kineosporiaceae bacterium]|nr:hypothetical protein [Kineosporiaceae bacterium]